MTELVTYGSVGGVGSNPGPYPATNERQDLDNATLLMFGSLLALCGLALAGSMWQAPLLYRFRQVNRQNGVKRVEDEKGVHKLFAALSKCERLAAKVRADILHRA